MELAATPLVVNPDGQFGHPLQGEGMFLNNVVPPGATNTMVSFPTKPTLAASALCSTANTLLEATAPP